MNPSTPASVALAGGSAVLGASKDAPSPFENPNGTTQATAIDALVLGKLRRLGILPAHLCSDAVFVRRVHLDVIGTLPTAQEARAFLADKSPTKRRTLIQRLLERDEFADYWAMKWSDLLRVKAEFPINLWPNAAQAYHRWIRTSVKENKPYDRFARELLTASGSNLRVAEVNFYRALQGREPAAIAQAVALTLMGTRIQSWPKDRQAGMAAFFSQVGYKSTGEWKEEILFFDRSKAAPKTAMLPDGTSASILPDQDPRELFTNWLVDAKNPWFARNVVNRLWSWLLGRGIVHEPDDIRADNPPKNPELLALLERELIAAKYDLKHVFRSILNSRTYQLSSVARSANPEGDVNFARYPVRRLEAEVLIDALCQITGTTESYSSPIPEPFTFIPENQRSIALPDGSITSSFLELFGRPARDTGLESERNSRPTAAQRLHMLNSSHIQRKLEQGQLLPTVAPRGRPPRQIIEEMYLTILSRFPTDDELVTLESHFRSGGLRSKESWTDLAWALINSVEFLYRH